MAGIPDRKGYSPRFPDEHNMITALLDAYSTEELEEGERSEVERHLVSCQQCQMMLTELKQLRHVFRQFLDPDSRPLSLQFHLPSVANDVLTQITQPGRQSMPELPLIEKRQEKPTTLRWKTLWLPIAASFLLALLLGSLAVFYRNSQGQPSGRPLSIPWGVQHEQTVALSHEDLFEIKYISITPKEFRFFYVVRSGHRDGLVVQAVSISPKGTSTPLATTVQALGKLGALDAGLLHVKLFHLTGQTIELHVTTSGKNGPTWKLAPLKQTTDEPGKGYWYGLSIQTQQPSGVLWFGPVKGETVAFFKENETKPDASYVFVRFDDATLVKVITRAQYLEIAGQENFR
jgi:hypothetical protein